MIRYDGPNAEAMGLKIPPWYRQPYEIARVSFATALGSQLAGIRLTSFLRGFLIGGGDDSFPL